MHSVGYTAVGNLGKSPRLNGHQSGKTMSRLIVLIIAVALIVGGLILLSTQAREVPTSTIETDVSPRANAN